METKLSAIGGTMGLMTGFSIISCIETVYGILNVLAGLIWKRVGLFRKRKDKKNKIDLVREKRENEIQIISLV